jgi:hypothetical protein
MHRNKKFLAGRTLQHFPRTADFTLAEPHKHHQSLRFLSIQQQILYRYGLLQRRRIKHLFERKENFVRKRIKKHFQTNLQRS